MRRGNLTRSPADSYGFVRPLGNWPAYCASAPRGNREFAPVREPSGGWDLSFIHWRRGG